MKNLITKLIVNKSIIPQKKLLTNMWFSITTCREDGVQCKICSLTSAPKACNDVETR